MGRKRLQRPRAEPGESLFSPSCLRLWQTEPAEPMAGSLFCIFFALLGMVFNQLGHLMQHGCTNCPPAWGRLVGKGVAGKQDESLPEEGL